MEWVGILEGRQCRIGQEKCRLRGRIIRARDKLLNERQFCELKGIRCPLYNETAT